jgi:diguanylate cyclase (GGDEF)-like protein/excisionase family DNA binding protein
MSTTPLPEGRGFDEWIAIEEAATYLAIPVRTLYRLAQHGRLPATKVGRTWRFKRSLLDAHLASGSALIESAARSPEASQLGFVLTSSVAGPPEMAPGRIEPGRARPDGPTDSVDLVHLQELAALADLSVRLAGLLDETEIVQFACGRLQEIFGVDGVGVLRLEHDEADGTDVFVPLATTSGETGRMRIPVAGSPLLARVVETGEPVVIEDLPSETVHQVDLVARMGLRSGVFVPIVEVGRLWGIFALVTKATRRFDVLELERLVAIAAQTGTALTNARLLAESRRWTEQLEGIEALSRQLNRSRAMKDVAEIVAREIGTLIDFDGLRFYVLQPDGETLEALTLVGNVDYYASETPELVRLRMGEGLGGTIAAARVGELIDDVLADPRMQDIPGTDEVDESMLVMPFLYDDEVLGVMELSRLGLGQFQASDLRIMQIFAAQASVALFNARQLEQLERRSADLERQLGSQRQLLNVTERLLQTREPSLIFEAIADTLSQVVPHDTLTIYLVDDTGGVLVPVIARDEYAQQILESRLPLGQGITGDVVARGEAEMVNDTTNDPRVVHVPGTPDDQDEAMIVAPLHNPNGVIGALNLYRIGAPFEASELDLVKLYANHAAIALENANVHEELLRAARTDPLTGLRHHGGFRDALAHALDTSSPVSVLMIDLDSFKAYNDRHGHQAGDRLLQRLATRLVASVRGQDVVCRYGGDEFAIVLPDTSEPGARAVAEKILAVMDEGGSRTARVGASIGIATFPDDARQPRDLVAVADTALYVAKHLGRGRAVSARELPTHIHHLREELGEMMAGAERDSVRQQLDVRYLVRPLHEVLRRQAPNLALDGERVAAVCDRVAAAMGLDDRAARALHAAALVSDIGRLVADEGDEAQSGMIAFAHPVLASRLLEPYPPLAEVASIVRHHHERWDGTGYPDELAGEQLAQSTRLLIVAGRYVDLVEPRDGSQALDPAAAVAVLRGESGTRLAPDAVEALASVFEADAAA